MLTQLTIQNIVLIERQEITCGPGLSVFTGETGAGKSIILQSLALILGARADQSLIRHGEDQARLSAEFDITALPAIVEWLAEQDLDTDGSDHLTIRRILRRDGSNRAYLNDHPVSLGLLKELGDRLAERHGQHAQTALQQPGFQRAVLDRYGHHATLLEETGRAWQAWKERERRLQSQRDALTAIEKEAAYLGHMREDLAALNPQENEVEELRARRLQIQQDAKQAEKFQQALKELESAGQTIDSRFYAAARLLARHAEGEEEENALAGLIAQLEQAGEMASDAIGALEKATAGMQDHDPSALTTIEDRLFTLHDAARKYRRQPEELAALYQEVDQKLTQLEQGQQNTEALERDAQKARESYLQAATALHDARCKTATTLVARLREELPALKLASVEAEWKVHTLSESGWGPEGTDEAILYASMNAGTPPQPLAKIASGGELSRFMLALHVLLATAQATPLLIFDEIDTGIGGAVAEAVGRKLAMLGDYAQVLAITHQPQVAAQAARHFYIHKQERDGQTVTAIETLTGEARQEELARMLAGATITEEARAAAARLLRSA